MTIRTGNVLENTMAGDNGLIPELEESAGLVSVREQAPKS